MHLTPAEKVVLDFRGTIGASVENFMNQMTQGTAVLVRLLHTYLISCDLSKPR